MKSIRKIVAVLLCICLFVPVGSNKTYADDPVPLDVEDVGYGQHALSYLNAIVSSFPARHTIEGASWACGDWIISKLTNMGYTVAIHDFTTKENAQPGRNIIVERYGNSDKTIVLCAHYDSVSTQGCDDNASGTAVLLEVAQRISRMKSIPECNLRIIFFDDEEEGPWGSQVYCAEQSDAYFENLVGVINIDSIAAGDVMYIHGGNSDGTITWFRDIALNVAHVMGLNMTTHPEVNYIPAGTRNTGSDQRYFAERGVPYVYFEANLYSNLAQDGLPMHYQTTNPEVPGGQIMHTPYDDMATIERLFPGRIASYTQAYTKLTLALAYNMTGDGQYSGKYFLPDNMAQVTTEAVEETTEPTTEEITETSTEKTDEETSETTDAISTEAVTTKAVKESTTAKLETSRDEKITLAPAATVVPVTMPIVVEEKGSDIGQWVLITIAAVLVLMLGSAAFIMFRIYNKMKKKKKRRKNRKSDVRDRPRLPFGSRGLSLLSGEKILNSI